MDRRKFFISTAAAAAASSTVFGSPNDTIRVATIGLRGRGKDHIKEITGQPNVELVALCHAQYCVPNPLALFPVAVAIT